MGIKLNSQSGGSVEINVDPGVTGAYQMKLPANGSGTILTTAAQYGSMKNRIINGDFRIDQRFAGAANNNIAGYQYVVDRWRSVGSAAGKLRYQQNNTNGPNTYVTQTVTGLNTYFGANVVSSNTVGCVNHVGVTVESSTLSNVCWIEYVGVPELITTPNPTLNGVESKFIGIT